MSGFNITDFPTEILEKIFLHFDDTTNAIATGVCKRFREVLNETVRRKYNGSSRNKWYEMEIFDSPMENEQNEIVQHRPFILNRASAIKLTFHAELNNRNHWIHHVINRIGRNIRMIRLATPMIDDEISLNFYNILSKTPNISHLYVDCVYPTNRKWCHQRYSKLTHLEMRLRTIFDENELKPFVKNNGQLTNVTLRIHDFRLLYAFDQTKIESLHCTFSHLTGKDVPVNIKPIRMTHLKSMYLEVPRNSLNECVEKIIAPCQNLRDLQLLHFDDIALTDETIDILCAFPLMEIFEPCFHMSLKHIVRLIDKLPTLVSIAFWYKTFTIGDYRVLLEAANKHPCLRRIRFRERMTDIYDQSVLSFLMENVNNRIQMEYSICHKLVITKGNVQYNGVTIMSSNGSPIEYGSVTNEWFKGVQLMSYMGDQYYEFFSNLPVLRALFDERENNDLHFSDVTDEGLVKRRGTNITTSSTTLSSNYDQSVNYINWLEKYCHRLQELYIRIENNHPQLPAWIFPELNILRINCDRRHHTVDLILFASFKCPLLNCLKFVGHHPVALTNIQVVHDIDLFDNLVTLQIFHFNESMNNLLEHFNRNVQINLRHLTLANRRVDGERYKINNKTIIAIATYPNLIQLKLILAGLNETNTKYLFESCTKLSELYFECNFLSIEENRCYSYESSRLFADIKSNCISLKRLQLVWHDRMMDPYKVSGIKRTFPNVLVKIMQIDDRMITTAEKIIHETDNGLERLFDEFEV